MFKTPTKFLYIVSLTILKSIKIIFLMSKILELVGVVSYLKRILNFNAIYKKLKCIIDIENVIL